MQGPFFNLNQIPNTPPPPSAYNFAVGSVNPLNTNLNPICHLLALLVAHPILHVSRIRVNRQNT
jgi:hypothetical protein